MFWDDTGTLLARLFISGPLLYIGLVMAMDPKGVVSILEAFANFTRVIDRRAVARPPIDFDVSPALQIAFRITGMAVCAVALLALTGLAG
jgi:hypothetical protein